MNKETAGKHLKAGAKKVIISVKGDVAIVQGLSKDLKKEHNVISMDLAQQIA